MANKDDTYLKVFTIMFKVKIYEENLVRNTAKITIHLEAWKTTVDRHIKQCQSKRK